MVPSTDPRRDGSLPYGGSCKGTTKDATWDTVYPTIAHNLWQYYGATGVVEDHWDHLKLYLSYLEAQYYSTANETADRKPSFAKYFCRYRSQCGWTLPCTQWDRVALHRAAACYDWAPSCWEPWQCTR